MKKKNQAKLALAAKKRYMKQIRAANSAEVRKDWERAYNLNIRMLELSGHDDGAEWRHIVGEASQKRMFAVVGRLWGMRNFYEYKNGEDVVYPALVEITDESPATDILACNYIRITTPSIHNACGRDCGRSAVDMIDVLSFIPPCAIDEVSRRIKEHHTWRQIKAWLLEIFSQFRETDDDEEKDPAR